MKKAETKNKYLINGQKILLRLFDDLVEAIYFVKKENNNNNNNNNNDNNNSNDDDNDDDVSDSESVSESESCNENDHDEDNYIIKQLNNYFKTIDEKKLFKE